MKAVGTRHGPIVRCPFDNWPNAKMGVTNWCGECGTIFRVDNNGDIVFNTKFKPTAQEAAGLTLWKMQRPAPSTKGAGEAVNLKRKKAATRLYDQISKAAKKAGYTTQNGYLSADGMVVRLEASVPEEVRG